VGLPISWWATRIQRGKDRPWRVGEAGLSTRTIRGFHVSGAAPFLKPQNTTGFRGRKHILRKDLIARAEPPRSAIVVEGGSRFRMLVMRRRLPAITGSVRKANSPSALAWSVGRRAMASRPGSRSVTPAPN